MDCNLKAPSEADIPNLALFTLIAVCANGLDRVRAVHVVRELARTADHLAIRIHDRHVPHASAREVGAELAGLDDGVSSNAPTMP